MKNTDEHLGELTQHPQTRWWESKPVTVPLLAGRPLKFVIATGDRGDDHAADVVESIARFLGLGERERVAASERVFANYRECLDATDSEPLDLEAASDIWRFVTPTEVRVDRRPRRDEDVYVTVLCECEWEPEHGLQLVFRRGVRLVRVSQQDGHLTRADAYDTPDEQDEWLGVEPVSVSSDVRRTKH